MTNATSKNTGIATMNPVSAIANGDLLMPKLRNIELARTSDPPECSMMAPKRAPRPTMVATKPSVSPIPVRTLSSTSAPSMPAISPTARALINSARNACILNRRIRNRRIAIPATTAISRRYSCIVAIPAVVKYPAGIIVHAKSVVPKEVSLRLNEICR